MIGKLPRPVPTANIAILLITLAGLVAALAATAGASGNNLAIAGPESPEMLENRTTVASYTTNAPETATVAWSLEGPDKDLLSIDAGALEFLTPPDRENPADQDSDNVYEVTLNASTSGENAQQATLDVQVTVLDVNEPPAMAQGTITVPVEVGMTTQGDLNDLFHDPEGDSLSFTVTESRDTSLVIAMDGSQVTLTASGENRQSSITIHATDGESSNSMRATVSITKGSTRPSPVQNLQAQPTADGFVLTWDAPASDGGGTSSPTS